MSMAKHARENEPSPAAVRKAVRDIEEQLTELLSLQGSYMNRCAKVRAKIKDIKDNAVEAGIPKHSLNIVLKRRGLRRKFEHALFELEKDERAEVSMLEQKCGWDDTPLGQAAVKSAKVVSINGKDKNDQRRPATPRDATPRDAPQRNATSDPKHDQQQTLGASVGDEALDDLTKH